MFTGEYIKRSAELYVGAELDNDDAIIIINEALETIGDLALHIENYNINAEGTDWCELPSDTTAINYITKGGAIYSEWSSDGTRIKFADAGTYLVNLRRMVPQITTLGDEIQIHPLFHKSITAYVRGFMKLMDDDQSADGQAQMQEFTNGVGLAHEILKNVRKRV